MVVVKLTMDNFDFKVLTTDIKVLVDFYADWCNPCKMMSPIIGDVANSIGVQSKSASLMLVTHH